jgi:hypothetical protein
MAEVAVVLHLSLKNGVTDLEMLTEHGMQETAWQGTCITFQIK